MLAVARDAFVHGMQLAAVGAAVVLVAAAVLAATLLRNATPPQTVRAAHDPAGDGAAEPAGAR